MATKCEREQNGGAAALPDCLALLRFSRSSVSSSCFHFCLEVQGEEEGGRRVRPMSKKNNPETRRNQQAFDKRSTRQNSCHPPSERGRGSACTRSIQTFASAARSVHTSWLTLSCAHIVRIIHARLRLSMNHRRARR